MGYLPYQLAIAGFLNHQQYVGYTSENKHGTWNFPLGKGETFFETTNFWLFFCRVCTLLETNELHLNIHGWNMIVFWGARPIFRGALLLVLGCVTPHSLAHQLSYFQLMIGVSNHLRNALYLGSMKPFSVSVSQDL